MTALRSILVATDFSEHARQAAIRAGVLARELGIGKVTLLHVAPPLPLAAELQPQTRAALRRALAQHAADTGKPSDVVFEPRLEEGSVAKAIRDASAQYDLVVVGARGTNLLRDLAVGTTAERLLRMSTRPVLVVKTSPAGPYRQVLVPVDFSAGSTALVSVAGATAPSAQLTLLHAFEVLFESTMRLASASEETIQKYRRQAHDQALREMDAFVARLPMPRERLSRAVSHGPAPARIVDMEKELRADLVVVGKHGKSLLEELLLGSVTLHTLAATACDVLVVPATPR
ncbi:MAG TPA: universal stress protein [Burkholderiales bacterium]|jgi:nucleotide-binding universal stress UspA family protein|nr:universal stress protein [Burkholderiales bacterium]